MLDEEEGRSSSTYVSYEKVTSVKRVAWPPPVPGNEFVVCEQPSETVVPVVEEVCEASVQEPVNEEPPCASQRPEPAAQENQDSATVIEETNDNDVQPEQSGEDLDKQTSEAPLTCEKMAPVNEAAEAEMTAEETVETPAEKTTQETVDADPAEETADAVEDETADAAPAEEAPADETAEATPAEEAPAEEVSEQPTVYAGVIKELAVPLDLGKDAAQSAFSSHELVGQRVLIAKPAPPAGLITLRKAAPLSQGPAPVVSSEPVFKKMPVRMLGDMIWPPKKAGAAEVVEDEPQQLSAKSPKMQRKHKDYRGFFGMHQLPPNFPTYRAPPGTQHFGLEDGENATAM